MLTVPACTGCKKPLHPVHQVFAGANYLKVWYCRNERCASYEVKVKTP